MVDFIFDSNINPQKISLASIAFGMFMIILGFRKKNVNIR